VPIDTNADELADRTRSAADELERGGLGVADRIGATMLAAARPPRRTGAYAGTLRVTLTPPAVSLQAGGGPVDYANIVEFGSRFVTGRHVLMSAVETSRPEWLTVAGDAVQVVLDKI